MEEPTAASFYGIHELNVLFISLRYVINIVEYPFLTYTIFRLQYILPIFL